VIFVRKPEPADDRWRDLRKRGSDAVRALSENFQPATPPKFKEALYQGYMEFLLTIFRSKCAYCESKLSGQPGDVEHFRPKGRVSDLRFTPVRVQDPVWGDIAHPGYYWLAYDWDNLLPSCADCNRFRWHEKGVGAGKADRFPVDGPYAVRPAQLAAEHPLLIDPSKVDPMDHLEVQYDHVTKSMVLVAKTPEGTATIEMFGLNQRPVLVQQRTRAYADAQAAFKAYVDWAGVENGESELARRRARVNEMWRGDDQYTRIQRCALRVMQIRYWANSVPIPLPIPDP
jgi:hypothetical protein